MGMARKTAEARQEKHEECVDQLFKAVDAWVSGKMTKAELDRFAGKVAIRLYEIYETGV